MLVFFLIAVRNPRDRLTFVLSESLFAFMTLFRSICLGVCVCVCVCVSELQLCVRFIPSGNERRSSVLSGRDLGFFFRVWKFLLVRGLWKNYYTIQYRSHYRYTHTHTVTYTTHHATRPFLH
ncbi:hypothetical protein P280DRAFT_3041 [Massarina eburnea CBS 473.64]|uniref:Uncharacterized protein n=1 Tax=Massarina eburnea CBS 473.64 TaxID=1395130 RepID=A0A6A6SIV9_9PLEO|nr:hypothetical protein P280DRAFT_3041 [Massarina eburnea CBS 473.64]